MPVVVGWKGVTLSLVANETTVARLTSSAPSAIAIIEVDGPRALDYVHLCWRPNQGSHELELHRIRFGYTISEVQSQGESVVVCRTGEQRVEMHCHGGKMASEQVLQQLVRHGAIAKSSKEHLQKSVTDEIEREAIEDLCVALTTNSTSILLDQMRGALRREFAAVDALIDSGEKSEALRRLRLLGERSKVGEHLIHPWRVVLAGPPNVGKSSLLNRLLGYSRAIVHEQAGTTRDLLTEQTSIDGWPIELVDGAGIRSESEASDSIESVGISRTLTEISQADCILYLVDSLSGWTNVHSDIANIATGKSILVYTKMDLRSLADGPKPLPSPVAKDFDAVVETSCLTGAGCRELLESISQVLVPCAIAPGEAVPFRQRHRTKIAKDIERATA